TRDNPIAGSLPPPRLVSRASSLRPLEKTTLLIRSRAGQSKRAFSRHFDRSFLGCRSKRFGQASTCLLQHQSSDITRWIGKHGNLGPSGDFGWRKDRFTAEILSQIERRLQIGYLGVNRNTLAAIRGRPDTTIDASRRATGIHDPVLHGIVTIDPP